MKNLKTTIILATLALCCYTQTNAQGAPIKGIIVKGGHNPKPPIMFSAGGGLSSPSSDGKDKAFLSNTTAINADAFFSLISKPEANFSFGLNFGGAYNFGGSGGFGTTPNPFAVTGQTSSMVSDRGGDPAQAGFRMGAGPQVNFYFGKFIVSPMVLGEYFSMTQKEMSIVQTTQFNGQSYDFNLATLPETKTSGFAVTPKLRLHYMFNDRFGLFADASYTMGPKIETNVSKLIPNGNPSPQSGSYNIQQLQTGTMVKGETKSTAYSTMGFNFGVVIGLGGNEQSRPRHTCLICGRKHRGICKNGATDAVISVGTDDIEQLTNCPPGTYPNGSQCYPCLGCHPCNPNVYQLPVEFCDNATGIKVFEGSPIEEVEITNQINASKLKISNEDKKRLLENLSEYKRSAEDIKKGWNGLADATEELEPTTPSNARTSNCCDATVTGSILWDPTGTGIASSFVPATPSMSISTATVTAAGGVYFNSTINCLTYAGCTATVTYKVNGVTVTGSPAPCGVFNIPASYLPVGSHTIKIIGNCAGVKCKAKKLQITIF